MYDGILELKKEERPREILDMVFEELQERCSRWALSASSMRLLSELEMMPEGVIEPQSLVVRIEIVREELICRHPEALAADGEWEQNPYEYPEGPYQVVAEATRSAMKSWVRGESSERIIKEMERLRNEGVGNSPESSRYLLLSELVRRYPEASTAYEGHGVEGAEEAVIEVVRKLLTSI